MGKFSTKLKKEKKKKKEKRKRREKKEKKEWMYRKYGEKKPPRRRKKMDIQHVMVCLVCARGTGRRHIPQVPSKYGQARGSSEGGLLKSRGIARWGHNTPVHGVNSCIASIRSTARKAPKVQQKSGGTREKTRKTVPQGKFAKRIRQRFQNTPRKQRREQELAEELMQRVEASALTE